MGNEPERLAPDDELRVQRRAQALANQEAREQRDLALLRIDNKYLPRIERLKEERRRLMVETYNQWLKSRVDQT
jgi:hypothetical protein